MTGRTARAAPQITAACWRASRCRACLRVTMPLVSARRPCAKAMGMGMALGYPAKTVPAQARLGWRQEALLVHCCGWTLRHVRCWRRGHWAAFLCSRAGGSQAPGRLSGGGGSARRHLPTNTHHRTRVRWNWCPRCPLALRWRRLTEAHKLMMKSEDAPKARERNNISFRLYGGPLSNHA